MSSYRKATLKNGTRVVFVPHRDTAAATVLALYEVGSRHEALSTNGAAHYIEHMMFKGTSRRKDTMSISRDLDSVGADYNAYTYKDHTGYYIRLTADRLPLAVDMLDDMLHRSLFRPKDMKSELNVILEEIRMYEDNPMSLADDLMEEVLFDRSPLGWKISGTVETMKGMKRNALMAFRNAHYVPSRCVLAVAGKFDETATLALLEKTFGRAPKKKEPKPFVHFAHSAAGKRPRVRIHHKDTEQVQVVMGFPGYSYADPRLPALNVLGIILGGTMSSRLFLSVREKEGLAYFVRSSASPFQDTGAFVVQAGLARERVHKAMAIIMKELAKIAAKDVTSEELNRAKEYVKGKTLLNLEDSSHLAEWYARQELLQRRVMSPEERVARVFAVTKDDVRRAAKDVLVANRMALAVVGPYSQADAPAFLKHASAL